MYHNDTESRQMRMRHHIQHDTADNNILNTVVNSHKGKKWGGGCFTKKRNSYFVLSKDCQKMRSKVTRTHAHTYTFIFIHSHTHTPDQAGAFFWRCGANGKRGGALLVKCIYNIAFLLQHAKWWNGWCVPFTQSFKIFDLMIF